MDISFVIPAFNEEKYVGACLRSLMSDIARHANLNTEIIVVDNASTDRTSGIARQFAGVRVAHEPIKGLARARQRGLDEAKGDLVAYLDADVDVPRGWIATFLKAFANNPDVVCVSGPYVYYDLPMVWRTLAWPYTIIAGNLLHLLTGEVIAGGNVIIRRHALNKIGGFDTSIIFYGEDIEMAHRLKKVGKILFTSRLALPSSARRFNSEGVLFTTALYMANSLSMAIRKKPITVKHRDVR